MATYSLFDEISAPTTPLPETHQRAHMDVIHAAFSDITKSEKPRHDSWTAIAGTVNMVEQLTAMKLLEDPGNLHADAVNAMAAAIQRYKADKSLRFDGPGVQAVGALIADYEEALKGLSYRNLIHAHRKCEKYIDQVFGTRTTKKGVKGRI